MKINRFHKLLVVAALAGLFVPSLRAEENANPAQSAELTIAAAADLKFAFDDVVKAFNEKHPASKVSITFGSSGNFFTQLQNGAPFDLFFSADIQYPKKLAEAGLTTDEVFPYSIGQIVVWVPKNSPLDVKKLGIKALLEASVSKIAIANPEHAPYGRAAVAALKTLNVYDQVQPKLVFGENIAQAAQFVQSGAADIGILALSLAIAPKMAEMGSYWEVPLDAYPKLEQGGVILKSAKNIEGARAFRDFVLGEQGRAILKHYGFFLPQK